MPVSSTILRQADRSYFLAALNDFAGKPREQWLGPGHVAASGQLPRNWTLMSQIPANQVIQLLAASAPNHCIDAWSYASRSISALLSGDAHACRHLSYYSQLRSSMSILANLGVGIFNRINFVIDSNGSILRLDPAPNGGNGGSMGTHEVVWDALSAWAADTAMAQYFSQAIKIRGVSLHDILLTFWPGMAIQSVASEIVQNWGLDLSRGKSDHSERNISSYVPHALNPINPTVSEAVDFVSETWRLLEPSSASAYDALDRYLLRSILQRHHERITGDTDFANGAIVSRYDQLSQSLSSLVTKDFLSGAAAEIDPSVVRSAHSNSSPAGAIEMLSRAFLLLRAASGFTQTSFSDAGISTSGGHMRPWLNQWAEERGFWSPAAPLPDPVDLWADVEIALIDLDSSLQPPPTSLSDWVKKTLNGLPTVAEAERAGIWSLSV